MLFFFAPFVALCVLLVGAAVSRPRLIYEYPYFMAATFTSFLLPQAYALYRNEWGGIYLEMTLVMASLCLACCWLGYRARPHPALLQKLEVRVNPGRFLQGGFLLVIIGWYFTYKFGTVPEEDFSGARSGITTVYLFFGGLVYPGFAICFYCALRERWTIAWVVSCVAASIPVQAAVFYGRRESTALFILSLGLSLFFLKGIKPPRLAIIITIGATIFLMPAISQYRSLAKEDPLAALNEIDFTEQFENSLEADAVSELKNAASLIAATAATGYYEYGAGYWNAVVFRFVPAQFVGKETKEALMIQGAPRDFSDFIEQILGFAIPVGTTVTGLGDSFNQFGYLGCLFFAALGYLV